LERVEAHVGEDGKKMGSVMIMTDQMSINIPG
jgi:hypothetical protein